MKKEKIDISDDIKNVVENKEDNNKIDDDKSFSSKVVGSLLEEDLYLFHDQYGDGYIQIEMDNQKRYYKIRSKDFVNYLAYFVWNEFEKSLSNTVKENVQGTLEAKAKFEGKEHYLNVRIGWKDGVLWYDLGNWKAVKITEQGWEVIDNPPMMFRNFQHQISQVIPTRNGNIEDMLKYVNLNYQKNKYYKILFLTYLVSCLIPDIPRPVLILHGVQGSAKSTFLKIVKRLIDPSRLELLTYPRNSEELIQILSHHYLIYFDNLSGLKGWQSDDLCKACTGQAFSKRKLYTDDEDVVYEYMRAVGINGINLVATKPDLLDRSLLFEFEVINSNTREDEQSFLQRFEEQKPELLGAVFELLSKAMALKNSGKVKLESKPRLADYAIWCAAVTKAMNQDVSEFTSAYNINIENQNSEAIESSTVAQTVIDFMKDKEFYSGPSKQLFVELRGRAEELGVDKDPDFPKSQRSVWKKMKIVKTNLACIGIEIRYLDKERPRIIEISNTNLNVVNGENEVKKDDLDISDISDISSG